MMDKKIDGQIDGLEFGSEQKNIMTQIMKSNGQKTSN